QRGDAGCASTSAVRGGSEVLEQARTAIDSAGPLEPYRWLARAVDTADQEFRVVMAYDSAATAAQQALVRTDLTAGAFIGHAGQFSDSLRLRAAGGAGPVAVMSFDRLDDAVAVMAAAGPLLFASCDHY